MLSHINELKHSYSLDQEFFKNYGISLVQTKDDILSTFEEYKTNSQKFITSGSKLDSETEKLNHFFDETQRLLTKLQKSSSSFHIKDTIFIEALLQVFRERKVFRDMLIQQFQSSSSSEKKPELPKKVKKKSRTTSTQTPNKSNKAPIFSELKDAVIHNLEDKVQQLRLIIASLLTHRNESESQIPKQSIAGLRRKFDSKKLEYGDELLEEAIQTLRDNNLYYLSPEEILQRSIVKNLERVASDIKLNVELKAQAASSNVLRLEPVTEPLPSSNQFLTDSLIMQDSTPVGQVQCRENNEFVKQTEANVEPSNNSCLQRTKDALLKKLIRAAPQEEMESSIDEKLTRPLTKNRSLIETRITKSPKKKKSKKNKKASAKSCQNIEIKAQLSSRIETLKDQELSSILHPTKKSQLLRQASDQDLDLSLLNKSLSPKNRSFSRSISLNASPSIQKLYDRSVSNFDFLIKDAIEPFAMQQPLPNTHSTPYQTLFHEHLNPEYETAKFDRKQELEKMSLAVKCDSEGALLTPHNNSATTLNSEVEKAADVPKSHREGHSPIALKPENTVPLQLYNRLASFSGPTEALLQAHGKVQSTKTKSKSKKKSSEAKENKAAPVTTPKKKSKGRSKTPKAKSKSPKKRVESHRALMTEGDCMSSRSQSTNKQKPKVLSAKSSSKSPLARSSSSIGSSKRQRGTPRADDIFSERSLKINTEEGSNQDLNDFPLSPEFGVIIKCSFPSKLTPTELVKTSTAKPCPPAKTKKELPANALVLPSSAKVHFKNYLPKYMQLGVQPLLKKNGK